MLTAAIALLLSVVFSSCQKSDYNPKKKISKVYHSYSEYVNGVLSVSYPQQLEEEWVWDKSKLTTIKLPEGALFFIYDNKNFLTEVNYGTGDWTKFTFEYKDKMLSKITILEDGSPYQIYEVKEVVDKKITKMQVTNINNYTWKDAKLAQKLIASVSRSVLSPTFCKAIDANEKMLSKKENSKATQEITDIVFTYTGDNVTTITYSYEDDIEIMQLQYDTKNNPYYHLYAHGDHFVISALSKNNMTQVNYAGEPNAETYEYKYDGNWPIGQTSSYTYVYGTESYTFNYTTYYEYVK